MTTKDLAMRAAAWLDNMMNHLLNTYVLSTCARVFGSNVDKMPRESKGVAGFIYSRLYFNITYWSESE